MDRKNVTLPLTKEEAYGLRAGDMLSLSGHLYTARDAAHKKMYEMIKSGSPLPFDIKGESIYYVGATPAKDGFAVGSAGPTSAYRMDKYAPTLLDMGQRVMIAKGLRSKEVIDAMIKNGSVYLGVTGGVGALIAKCIKSAKLIAFPELLSEAVYRYEIEDFPCVVLIDTKGNNLYAKNN